MSLFFVIGPVFRLVMRFVSIIVWALTILSAYGGKFNPQYFAIPSILCLALPYLAILSIILILFWALSKKFVFTAIGILAMLAIMGPLSQVMPLSASKKPDKGQQTFKIIAWNCLHTDDVQKPDFASNRAVEYLMKSDAEIVCLAELRNFSGAELKKTTPAERAELFAKYPYQAGKKDVSDIKILSKYPVESVDVGKSHDGYEQRFEAFRVDLPNHPIHVIMVHLYSYDLTEEERNIVTDVKSVDSAKSSVKEFKGSVFAKLRHAFRRRAENAMALREAIDKIEGPLIVCGDFNDVAGSWAYNIIRKDDLRDAYPETNFGPAFTYNQHLFLFHIDQMLYRGPIEALSLKIGKIKTSDHYPLIGTFAFTNPQ